MNPLSNPEPATPQQCPRANLTPPSWPHLEAPLRVLTWATPWAPRTDPCQQTWLTGTPSRSRPSARWPRTIFLEPSSTRSGRAAKAVRSHIFISNLARNDDEFFRYQGSEVAGEFGNVCVRGSVWLCPIQSSNQVSRPVSKDVFR